MGANMASILQLIAISALPVIFAITLHEAAHGYAARHFGDSTAWDAGRVSLNPLHHIDLVGTLIVPLVALLASGGAFLFGWAKPVPVRFDRLRHPKRDMLWVAFAGPAANLAQAAVWALLLKLAWSLPGNAFTLPLSEMAKMGLVVNFVLAALNLLPLPPLDGGRILVSLLPMGPARWVARLEPFGFPILLILMLTHTLGQIVGPLVDWLFILYQFVCALPL